MLATFQRAIQRRHTRIAGVKLPPLTLAHAYCLHAWESPLVCGGQVDPPAFSVALWTCSLTRCYPFDRFTRAVCRGVPDRVLARLGKRYDLRRYAQDVQALREWIRWHCTTPERFITPRKDDRGAAAPWPMLIAVQVLPILGERATWSAPLPWVMAHKIALDNAAGDTSWKSEAEEAQGYANDSGS